MDKLERQKLRENINKINRKLEKMTAEEYHNFMEKLVLKVKALEENVKAKQDKLDELQNVAKLRTITENEISAIIVITEPVMIAISGVLAYFLSGEQVEWGYVGGYTGICLGAIPTWLNILAYEKKPLSNFLNEIRINTLKKKLWKERQKTKENRRVLKYLENV